jgi:hypothetical protein
MVGKITPGDSDYDREAALILIRKKAEQGTLQQSGVRAAGAPFPKATPEGGYYGIPLLEPPAWTWEIPLYFFVGGAAGSAAVIATAAEWFGSDVQLARNARWVSLAGISISSVLLISDLGRPERFLAMLRVFKPQSPMSMGAWILASFGTFTGAAVMSDMVREKGADLLPIRIVGGAAKALSSLFALPFSNYTGVLIGATAIPVWNRNVKSLPIHFGMSGLQSAVSVLELLGYTDNGPLNVLGIGSAAWETFEGVLLEGRRDPILEPLKRGKSGWVTRAGGVLSGPLPLALRLVAAASGNKRSRKLRRLAALSGIAGSLLTRYGWVMAGAASVKQTAGNLDT